MWLDESGSTALSLVGWELHPAMRAWFVVRWTNQYIVVISVMPDRFAIARVFDTQVFENGVLCRTRRSSTCVQMGRWWVLCDICHCPPE